jgi:hypothetical protein
MEQSCRMMMALSLAHLLGDKLPDGIHKGCVVTIPLAAPMMLIGGRELLNDCAGGGIHVDARGKAVTVARGRWEGRVVFNPVHATRTGGSEWVHQNLP